MVSTRRVSVRPARNPRAIWLAHIICSGRDCLEELEVVIAELDELDRLGCDCGHGFVLLSISEVELVTP